MFLKHIVKTEDKEHAVMKFFFIADLLDSITNPDLLKKSVMFIRRFGMLPNTSSLDAFEQYRDDFSVKHRASVFALNATIDILNAIRKVFDEVIPDEVKSRYQLSGCYSLNIKSDVNGLWHNLDEVQDDLVNRYTLFVEYSLERDSVMLRKQQLREIITDLQKKDFFGSSNTFSNSIDYLKIVMENTHLPLELPVDYNTRLFSKDGILLLDYLLTNTMEWKRGWRFDICFYYRKMVGDKLIFGTQEEFRLWFDNHAQYSVHGLLGQIKRLEDVVSQKRIVAYQEAKEVLM